MKDSAGILRCRRGFKDSRIPEARQIGRYGFELLRQQRNNLFQDRRVCGKPEINKTFVALSDRSKAIFLASLFASKKPLSGPG